MFSKDVMEMNREEFMQALEQQTTPGRIWDNAGRIYEHMEAIFHQEVMDSLLREWSFQWASEKMKVSYDTFFDKWLES